MGRGQLPYHVTYPMMHLMLPTLLPPLWTGVCENITFPQLLSKSLFSRASAGITRHRGSLVSLPVVGSLCFFLPLGVAFFLAFGLVSGDESRDISKDSGPAIPGKKGDFIITHHWRIYIATFWTYAPSLSNFLNFYAVFGEIWPNNRMAPPPLRVGNPGSYPAHTDHSKSNCRFWNASNPHQFQLRHLDGPKRFSETIQRNVNIYKK